MFFLLTIWQEAGGRSVEKKIEKEVENITSLEDIEIFEKTNGCSFVFMHNFDDDNYKMKLYGVRDFLQKNTSSGDWTEKSIKETDRLKENCKNRKVATLIVDGGDFKGSEEPYGGWASFNN